jgi:SAM-dependent methyltransferase
MNTSPDYKKVIDAYTQLKPLYDETDDGINEWLFRDIILKYIKPSMRNALDVGCGAGRMALAVARRIPNVTGIDITPVMIEAAQQKTTSARVKFVVGDIQTYEIKEHFDFIYAVFSLGYVDRPTTIAKLRDHLNVGGRMILIDGITDQHAHIDSLRGQLQGLFEYFRFRLRHGLGLNIRALARNTNRAFRLYAHPAWKMAEEWHTEHAITWPEYQALILKELPSAKTELITREIGFVLYTA